MQTHFLFFWLLVLDSASKHDLHIAKVKGHKTIVYLGQQLEEYK